MLTTSDIKQEIAQAAGISVDSIRSHVFELNTLHKKGLLVDVNITGLSMFERAVKFDEIGMQPGDVRKDRIRPGRKSTLPSRAEVEELYSVSTSARNLLRKYSHNIPGFAPYNWLTFQAFSIFKEKFTEYQTRAEAIVDRLANKVDVYRDELAAISAAEARQAWLSMSAQGYAAVSVEGKIYTSQDDYVDAQVERDLASLPDAEVIRAQVKMDYVVGMMWTAVDIDAEAASAELAREQLRAERDRNYMLESEARERFRHEQALNQEREDRERELRERILAEEMEHVRQQIAEQGSPFDTIVQAMRVNAAESAREMLASIRKSGFVHGKVAEKGRGLFEYFKLMSVKDDDYLSRLLTALDTELVKAPKDRKADDIADILEQINTLANQEVAAVTANSARFSNLEV